MLMESNLHILLSDGSSWEKFGSLPGLNISLYGASIRLIHLLYSHCVLIAITKITHQYH
jgi:hypothetical protein